MATIDVSTLGYLSRHAYENQSPVVHLQCGGDLLSLIYKRWSTDDIFEYLLYIAGDSPIDSFFKAFLFSPNRASSGRFINPLFIGFEPPTNQLDWSEWHQELFSPESNLHALQMAVQTSGQFCSCADVWITIPYPECGQTDFGVVNGRSLDFRQLEDRITALQWWLEQFAAEWSRIVTPQVSLRGFRWGRETILGPDVELVRATANLVHQQGLQFMFLTHYGSLHTTDWDTLGFDVSVLHPNYHGKTNYKRDWIDNAAHFAMFYHTGLQLTCGKGLLYDDNHIYDYLNRGLPEYRGYMNEAFTVFNFDRVSPHDLYQSQIVLYIEIYCFVKGIYKKRSYPGINY